MHFTKVLGLALALACVTSVAQAQYTLSIGTSGAAGDGSASVNLDSSAGGDIQGWSLAVCHNAADTGIVSVGDGAATAVVGAGGGPPAFNTITLFPDGWTVGVVIDFLGCCTLAPGVHELHVMEYDLAGLPEAETPLPTDICFCSATLGSPAVAVVVVVGGASIPPEGIASCGTLFGPIISLIPDWIYSGSDETAGGGLGAAVSATVGFSITETDGSGSDTQGFSMGWSAAGGTNVSVSDPVPAGDLAAINGGTGPSFFGSSTFGADWTVGVVYNFLGGVFLQFPTETLVATADYSAEVGGGVEVITISVDNTLGSPPVSNVVVVGGASFQAGFDPDNPTPGTITVSEITETSFIRGDCNDDGIVNIADAVWTLNELFLSGPASPCAAACDSNGDGMVDATDASYTLNYRFLDGPPPPAPFPDCGPDGGPDCAASACP